MADIDVTQYQIGDNTYHYKDASIGDALDGKVDKETGKSLMLDTDKTKLDNIEAEATKTIIDDDLSLLSENPVQNKIVTEQLNLLGRTASNQHTGLIKVGGIFDVENDFLTLRNYASITPSYSGENDVAIATYSNNDGTNGNLKIPYSAITPSVPNQDIPIEDTLEIATFNINGTTGSLRVPTSSNVSITPIEIQGETIKIADFEVNGEEGSLYAPVGGGSGGGGGPVVKDTLYNNTGQTPAMSITLFHPYTDYDLLYFTVIKDVQGDPNIICSSIETSRIVSGDLIQIIGGSATSNWSQYEVVSSTVFDLQTVPTGAYLQSIVGIKLNSGDSVSVTPVVQTGTKIATITINSTDTDIYVPADTDELVDLTDTDIDDQTLADGDVLKWDDTNSKWINAPESGGTTVVANPSGSATADLEKVQIGSTIYKIPTVSYSTTERIVGTWLGDTLYEITLDLGSSTTFNPNVWTTISGVTMPNCICKRVEASDDDGTYSNTFPIAFSINRQTGQLDLNQFRSTTISVRWITIQYIKVTSS